jgi:predicted nucleic acid-binding protein
VIVLDTTVLAYAVGVDHPLKQPSERIVAAIAGGSIHATTTVEVIQEFLHIRSRRLGRPEAAATARNFAQLLSPLLVADEAALERGVGLFERHDGLGAFDAVLAAASIDHGADALVSADRAFAVVRRLPFIELGTPALERLLG